ncbi:MAG: hypothetical protein PVF76_11830 [Syntrophobacterales bacterium]
MKKAILFGLVGGLVFMLGSLVMAKKKPGIVPPPPTLNCPVDNDVVGFDWMSAELVPAPKYSLDVEIEIDLNDDGENDNTVEFSYSTVEPFLNVPVSDFKYDIDGDGNPDQLTGPATAKVKGLDPGKGKGRQNNLFSPKCDFTIPE